MNSPSNSALLSPYALPIAVESSHSFLPLIYIRVCSQTPFSPAASGYASSGLPPGTSIATLFPFSKICLPGSEQGLSRGGRGAGKVWRCFGLATRTAEGRTEQQTDCESSTFPSTRSVSQVCSRQLLAAVLAAWPNPEINQSCSDNTKRNHQHARAPRRERNNGRQVASEQQH